MFASNAVLGSGAGGTSLIDNSHPAEEPTSRWDTSRNTAFSAKTNGVRRLHLDCYYFPRRCADKSFLAEKLLHWRPQYPGDPNTPANAQKLEIFSANVFEAMAGTTRWGNFVSIPSLLNNSFETP